MSLPKTPKIKTPRLKSKPIKSDIPIIEVGEFGDNVELEELVKLKQQKLALLEEKAKHQASLPHLYGHKFYPWMRDYWEDFNRDSFITSANQVGKSSIQIRRLIRRATDTELWPRLWKTQPRTFWYLYPSQSLATAEFEEKWVPEFLPRGDYKASDKYGWKSTYDSRNVSYIRFKSGVTIYFKAYSQDVHNLQAGTVWEIDADEEMPHEYFDELNFRRMATDGYFSMVFTATRGEEFWRCTMEEQGTSLERFKGAFKKQVSLFDCQTYEDGTKSHWTDEKIKRAIASCKSEAEVQRRIYGRFVKDEGLKYPSFSRKANLMESFPIPSDWHWFGGVDIGAGGDKNHPSSIAFVAVKPDFSFGVITEGWQGREKLTTMHDVLNQWIKMRGKRKFMGQFYDYHAKDFHTYASRAGESFLKAEKSHEVGEQVLNVLFKNKMLMVFNTPELMPLVNELATVPKVGDKRKLIDDFADAARYAVTRVPWNWEVLDLDKPPVEDVVFKPLTGEERRQKELKEWRKAQNTPPSDELSIEETISSWNELYDV